MIRQMSLAKNTNTAASVPNPKVGHILAEQVGLLLPQFLPIHPVALGSLEQRIVDVGDILHEVHAVAIRQ